MPQYGFEAWESISRSSGQWTREAEQGTGKGDQGPEPELHVRRDIKEMCHGPDERALGNRMGRVGRKQDHNWIQLSRILPLGSLETTQ